MTKISPKSSAAPPKTELLIESGVFSKIGVCLPGDPPAGPAVIVTDTNVGPLYADKVLNSFRAAGQEARTFTFDAGEPSKTLETAFHLYNFLASVRMPRDGLIVALGGGVVGDLAGFVAGTWMRGVPWVYCPTTMEADVDACLGGKTAVNLPGGKNLVGVFHDPLVVAVDPNCLRTLPQRDIRAGLAEAIKHALLQSTQEVEWLESNAAQILALHPQTLTALIERNLRFKGHVVSDDPHEQLDRRILLNFGHTIGHAIETCAEGKLRHGECVALGMLAACRISHRAGLLGTDDVERIRQLLTQFGLPTQLETPLDRERLLGTLTLDKKNTGHKRRLVLLGGLGTPIIRDDIPANWMADAYDSLREWR